MILHYECLGDPQAPAVMLLHGFMSSNAQWLMNQALAQHHHLVMVELWGHGSSPLPEDDDAFTVAAYVDQFEAIREKLDIDRWAVVGQSYGAGLVIRYAARQPDRVPAVVVTNSRSAFGQVPAAAKERPQADLRAPELELRALPDHPVHARRFPEHVKAALVASADAMTPEAVRRSGRLGARLNCLDMLSEVRAPMLLTNGQYEKSFQADAAYLREAHPHIEVVDLPAGHSVNIEAHEQFDAAVRTFLAKAKGLAAGTG